MARNNVDILRHVDQLYDSTKTHAPFQSWADSTIRKTLIDTFLEKVYFEEISDRHDRISAPFPDTFTWVFETGKSSSVNGQTRTMIKDWLSTHHSTYLVTGKAGSGKLTLMRCIYNDSRTKLLLKGWSSKKPLTVIPFFFWNSGTRLQMSQEGLVRSVLYHGLSQRRNLSQKPLPHKWDAFTLSLTYSDRLGVPKPWKWSELVQAFRFMIEAEDDIAVKYAFFIDGLDEFEGDKSNLISLIGGLSSYKNVKICLASRPWNEFEDAYNLNPTRRLHEHTSGDISHYVRKSLAANLAFREFHRGKPIYAERLVENITSKASGVFLWVVLVVRSLLEGLRDGDRISDLQQRLDELPAELEELFKKMLGSQKSIHLQHACRIFQVFQAARTRMSVLVLSFADEDDDYVFSRDISPLQQEELYYRATSMKRRLNSRCRGLLEAAPMRTTLTEEPLDENKDLVKIEDAHLLADAKVEYMHRTVRDFFAQPAIEAYIQSHCPPDFVPEMSLYRASILQLKTLTLECIMVLEDPLWDIILWSLRYAASAASTAIDQQMQLFDAVDQIATIQATRTDSGTSLMKKYRGVGNYHWSSLPPGAEDDDDFVTLAARCHFSDYAKAKLLEIQCTSERVTRVLRAVMSTIKTTFFPYPHPDPDLVQFLLEHGADVNHEIGGLTSWQCVLDETTSKERDHNPIWDAIETLYAQHGMVTDKQIIQEPGNSDNRTLKMPAYPPYRFSDRMITSSTQCLAIKPETSPGLGRFFTYDSSARGSLTNLNNSRYLSNAVDLPAPPVIRKAEQPRSTIRIRIRSRPKSLWTRLRKKKTNN